MNEYCKKFLAKKVGKNNGKESIEHNKRGAKEQIGIPEELWEGYSYSIGDTTFFKSLFESASMEGLETALHGALMAGFVCGWKEQKEL